MAPDTASTPPLPSPQPTWRRAWAAVGRMRLRTRAARDDAPASGFLAPWLVVATLFVAFGVGEWSGWPWLARPLELGLGAALQRPVQIGPATTPATARLSLRLLGALHVEAAQLHVAAPPWSDAPHLLLAHNLAVELRYIDLWRAWQGQPWRVERLHVGEFDLRLQRLADGRVSWLADPPVAGTRGAAAATPWPALPAFAHLQLATGTLQLDDAITHSGLLARLSLVSASSPLGSPWDTRQAQGSHAALPARRLGGQGPIAWAAAREPDVSQAGDAARGDVAPWPQSMLKVIASGHYGRFPLQGELLLGGSLPAAAAAAGAAAASVDASASAITGATSGAHRGASSGAGASSSARAGLPVAQPLGVNLTLSVGTAALAFDGQLVDPSSLQGLSGRFRLSGPSLAAVGDPVGVTLPSTGAFSSVGDIGWRGRAWLVTVRDASVGASRLNGRFSFEPGARVPLLRGTLAGPRLLLADLGPALGTTALSSQAQRGPIPAPPGPAPTPGPARLLPDRDFDLAALRVMDADVDIRLTEVDLGSALLQPLRPLKARLLLRSGVLTLVDLDARTGQGRLGGQLRLDGRASPALFDTDLRWDGVQLERWLHLPPTSRSRQPWVTGRLGGRARLHGRGSSTADILASLKGEVHAELQAASVSRLTIELAGLDLLSSLGLLLRGDERLPVLCAVADLVADAGVLRPRVMVLDTRAAAIWVGGRLSLADETLDLRAVVRPKGPSLLALRAPLHVRGSFVQPVVSVERGVLAQQVAAALLLSLAHPLAGLLPLVDPGASADPAALRSAGCSGPARPAPPAMPTAPATDSAAGGAGTSGPSGSAGLRLPVRAQATGPSSLAPALPEPLAPVPGP